MVAVIIIFDGRRGQTYQIFLVTDDRKFRLKGLYTLGHLMQFELGC